MKTKSLNYICCPNGYGHFKRFVEINKLLERHKILVNLYTCKNKWISFKNFFKINFSNISLKNTKNFPVFNYKIKQNEIFFRDLSKKLNNDLIVCDNYIEISKYKTNVIILANFLWNIKNSNHKHINDFDKYLNNKNIFIYGNKYIYADYMDKIKNYKKIGFFGNEYKKKINTNSQNNILFVKGFGSFQDTFEKQFQKKYEIFKKNYLIFFDKNIKFAVKKKLNIVNKFDDNLLTSLKIIIGRPSFGIITESISKKIPFYPIKDKKDFESISMKKRIHELFGDYKNIDEYIKNVNHKFNSYKFEFNAEKSILKEILKNINL